MLPIFRPMAFSARTADSRPGPGPLMRTSMFFTPHSCAARPQRSAATCAANGVDLREPLKPALPEVAQASVLPWRSVIVTMVLLHAGGGADRLRASTTDAEDRSQRDPGVLVVRNVYPCNACHRRNLKL